jgi:hypothetical protein
MSHQWCRDNQQWNEEEDRPYDDAVVDKRHQAACWKPSDHNALQLPFEYQVRIRPFVRITESPPEQPLLSLKDLIDSVCYQRPIGSYVRDDVTCVYPLALDRTLDQDYVSNPVGGFH